MFKLFNIRWFKSIFYVIIFLVSTTYGETDDYTQGFVKNFDQIHSMVHHWTYLLKKPYFQQLFADINLGKECRQTLQNMLEYPEQEWSSLSKFLIKNFQILIFFII